MIDKNDPRLTAYVLGDLEKSEVAVIDAALESSEELRTFVAEIRQTTEALASAFRAEPELLLSEKQKSEVLAAASANSDVHYSEIEPKPINYSVDSNSFRRWLPIAVAAGLMCVLVGGGIYLSQGSNQTAARLANDTTEATLPPDAADKLDLEQKSSLADANLSDDTDDDPNGFKFNEDEMDQSAEARLAIKKGDRSNHGGKQAAPAMARSMGDDSGTLLAESSAGGGLRKSFSAPKTQIQADSRTGRNQSDSDKGAEPQLADMKTAKALVAGTVEKDAGVAMIEPTRSDGDAELDQLPKAANSAPKPRILMPENGLIKTAKEIQMAQTQKMIDQSNLGILGMQIVAAQPPTNSGGLGKIAGGGLGGSNQPTSVIPVNKHALQISKETAEQAVELLARNIDPSGKRELSFDDLISLVSTDRSNSSTTNRHASGMNRRLSKAEKEAKLRGQATQQLAFNLRSFIGQRSPETLPELGAGGSVDLAPDTFGGDEDGTPNRSVGSKAGARTKHSADRKMNQDSRQFNAWSNLQLLDLDYSQVIEQLKISLKRRNEKLKAD